MSGWTPCSQPFRSPLKIGKVMMIVADAIQCHPLRGEIVVEGEASEDASPRRPALPCACEIRSYFLSLG